MFKVGDYLVYRRDVCKIEKISEKKYNNEDYYVLVPLADDSLKINVPISNKSGNLRGLLSIEEVNTIIDKIPDISTIKANDKLLEHEYKNLMNSCNHEDLIKIIKTTYLRNKKRADNNLKAGAKDITYFKQAEEYLYNEFSIVLGMSIDKTKDYIINKVEALIN